VKINFDYTIYLINFANSFKNMRKILLLLTIFLSLVSCSEYQKVTKNPDIPAKIALAEKLYNEGKFGKAITLYEQIKNTSKGKVKNERIDYFYSDALFQKKRYLLSQYTLERFAKRYPKSEKAEQAAFNSIYSYYVETPIYSLDQTDTYEAITKIQKFIDTYPNSKYMKEANQYMKDLNTKLERKDFEIAKQQHDLEAYKSAIKNFDNFLLDYPGTTFKEEALFFKLKSAYLLGINSVEKKKEMRLKNALSIGKSILKHFPNSKYIEEINKMSSKATELLNSKNN